MVYVTVKRISNPTDYWCEALSYLFDRVRKLNDRCEDWRGISSGTYIGRICGGGCSSCMVTEEKNFYKAKIDELYDILSQGTNLPADEINERTDEILQQVVKRNISSSP